MKIEILNAVIWILTYAGIMALMNWAWEMIDILQYGSPQPSIADTIVGAILAAIATNSLTKHLKLD